MADDIISRLTDTMRGIIRGGGMLYDGKNREMPTAIPETDPQTEQIAKEIFEYWKETTKKIAQNETLSHKRATSWQWLWNKEYEELPPRLKEQERVVARKIVSMMGTRSTDSFEIEEVEK